MGLIALGILLLGVIIIFRCADSLDIGGFIAGIIASLAMIGTGVYFGVDVHNASACPNCGEVVQFSENNYCSACGLENVELMHCSNCNARLNENDRFCSNCGSAVGSAPKASVSKEAACPECEAKIPDNAKFCPKCGTETQAVEGEEASAATSTTNVAATTAA